MEEAGHIIEVLKLAKKSLLDSDSGQLKELSNQTIHSASTLQDAGSITLAVIIYTLSKLIERKDNEKISGWQKFTGKFNAFLDIAIKSLREKDLEGYEKCLHEANKSLVALSVNLKPYVQEVMRKASINKASRIYEHGISMEHTAKLLGITQWELAEYAGQRTSAEPYAESISAKKRASEAMEFFNG